MGSSIIQSRKTRTHSMVSPPVGTCAHHVQVSKSDPCDHTLGASDVRPLQSARQVASSIVLRDGTRDPAARGATMGMFLA